jgi:hypothetical protein
MIGIKYFKLKQKIIQNLLKNVNKLMNINN